MVQFERTDRAARRGMTHPLVFTTVVAIVARIAGLLLYYFGRDSAGRPLVPSPISTLLVAVPYHVAVLAGLAAMVGICSRTIWRRTVPRWPSTNMDSGWIRAASRPTRIPIGR